MDFGNWLKGFGEENEVFLWLEIKLFEGWVGIFSGMANCERFIAGFGIMYGEG